MLRASKMHCLFRDYCEELRDSLDLVPIGAWHGNGRKVGWYSPFLLAAYDPDTEEFQSVCRCMSGYTDAFYAEASLVPHTPAACSTACAWGICYGKRLNCQRIVRPPMLRRFSRPVYGRSAPGR